MRIEKERESLGVNWCSLEAVLCCVEREGREERPRACEASSIRKSLGKNSVGEMRDFGLSSGLST